MAGWARIASAVFQREAIASSSGTFAQGLAHSGQTFLLAKAV